MCEEESQFDSLLGGCEDLPSSLSFARFMASRNEEMQQMRSTLLAQTGSKLAFQTLPKHMRRRAMSHNVKRLPRRLRQIHLNQMRKSGPPSKQKRPSRKYRRRPRNLQEEYAKRSGKKWLQTHVWHAKRFRMVERWGYKLPYCPNDKAFRACYRATARHCLLQDISYVTCVEITGEKSVILENLKRLCRVGLGFGAKAFINGNREGELTLFEERAIGVVNYQWKPGEAKLWLWVHAAFYNTVLNSLVRCFDNSQVRVQELGGELSRFRLTGTLSSSVLRDALVVFEGGASEQEWLKKYEASNKELLERQVGCWKLLSSVSPHTVLSLIVEDPRLNLPKKRLKSSHEAGGCGDGVVGDVAASPLWDEEIRREVNENTVSQAKIIEMQSDLLVPGSDLKENRFYVPIILVHRPGNKVDNIGFGGGWDLIVPSSWAKPFWTALIMRGARAGGLRESKSLLFEMGKSQFLRPDTKAGMNEEERISNECVEKFFRKPPNKRINYNKFNIASPLRCNWKLLIQDWNDEPVDDFVVLRDVKILRSVDLFLNAKTQFEPELPHNCLIPVKLECEKRGSPCKFAIICLPKSESDFKHVVLEKPCLDKYQTERKQTRHAHKSLLKRLKKRRKLKCLKSTDPEQKQELITYRDKMRSLWLPPATTVRKSCSREVVGFVEKGGFSFSHGKSFATGYVTGNCLKCLMVGSRNKVLIRNTNSRQYRTAKMSVIVE